MGKQHIIELNGKRYDALTGKMITDQPFPHKNPQKPLQPVASNNMDGFAKRPSRPTLSPKEIKRPVQKSHTLMRETVHRPQPHKVHAIATVVSQHTSRPETSLKVLPAKTSTPKSPLIRKFGPPGQSDISTAKSPSESPLSSPVTAVSKAAVSAAATVVSPFQQAIAHATAHQQPKLGRQAVHKRVAHRLHISPRVLSGGSLVLAGLLLIAFFSYQNMPNLRMRLAASRAGVHGSLPAYQPPGFHLQDISYKTGQVDLNYASNSDARSFKVTQIASAWNTDTLRDKLKTESVTDSPVEVPDKGKTLFIYDESNITWVDGGVLYKVEGESKLSSDQLLRLANSL